jgi:hypothetical protein
VIYWTNANQNKTCPTTFGADAKTKEFQYSGD